MRTVSPEIARRLAITRQRLAGPYPPATAAGMLSVVRDIGCLQLDPISAVARSHLLVLRSRVGNYPLAELDHLLWKDRHLFEYWAHAASIVLTEDYPIHQAMMRQHGQRFSAWDERIRSWVAENDELRRHILTEIEQHGPLPSAYFEDKSDTEWHSMGWTAGRNVNQMLDYLWITGAIMVAGRKGLQKLWDLTERCLPDWAPRDAWPEREIVRTAAQKSLRALGVAPIKHIQGHYIRGRYPGLETVLDELEAEGRIERVEIGERASDNHRWPGPWYIHTDDLPLLERLEAGEWTPRTTLLSPFDNLICDRDRTEKLFNFKFRIEIYTPKVKRQYGYYVLPILHGDTLIGRIDPIMNRAQKSLTINAVYAEPDAPKTRATARAVRGAIEELGAFLGAQAIVFGAQVPDKWRRDLV